LFFNIENVANNLLAACTEYNDSDFADIKPETKKLLLSALNKIHDYSYWNEDFKAVSECLRAAYDN